MNDQESAEATNNANFYSLPGAGSVVELLGTRQMFKAEALQTAGQMVCAEITVPPGCGIAPHGHSNEDESFYVLEGHIVMEGDDFGGEPVSLGPGGFFYGPRGRVHSFRCDGAETARLLVFASPGTGIGAMYQEIAEVLRRENDGVDPERLAEICSRYGITFVQ